MLFKPKTQPDVDQRVIAVLLTLDNHPTCLQLLLPPARSTLLLSARKQKIKAEVTKWRVQPMKLFAGMVSCFRGRLEKLLQIPT